jgi:hypothetical protein
VFYVFHNILINIQEQDPDKNLGGKKPNKNNKIVDIIDNQYNKQGYNIIRKKVQKTETKRDKITIII